MKTIVLSPVITKTNRYGKWKTYVENVALISDGFPWAIAHIDTFYNPQNNDIYNRLRNGEIVNVELSIVRDEINEQDRKEIERVNHAIMAGMPSGEDNE